MAQNSKAVKKTDRMLAEIQKHQQLGSDHANMYQTNLTSL